MLIGACNPMSCPIRVFRRGGVRPEVRVKMREHHGLLLTHVDALVVITGAQGNDCVREDAS